MTIWHLKRGQYLFWCARNNRVVKEWPYPSNATADFGYRQDKRFDAADEKYFYSLSRKAQAELLGQGAKATGVE